ncbi:hypothetical protein ACFTOW_14950, partial [Lacimonas salitolerans]
MTALAARIRETLGRRDPEEPLITYQALASALGLQPPGTIQRIATALEQTMREDVAVNLHSKLTHRDHLKMTHPGG